MDAGRVGHLDADAGGAAGDGVGVVPVGGAGAADGELEAVAVLQGHPAEFVVVFVVG